MKKWIAENIPWLTFLVMAQAGAIVAHIKAFEKAGIVWSVGQHVRSIIIKSIYAGFAGLLIYLLFITSSDYGHKISEPLAFVIAGIGGMFGAEFCEFLFVSLKALARRVFGIKEETTTS